MKVVAEFPTISARESPTVAIVTSLFCEKVAVDMTLDYRMTYIKHSADAQASANAGKFGCSDKMHTTG